MGHPLRIERSVTVNAECAHYDAGGALHGHSYVVECWTPEEVDMVSFAGSVRAVAAKVDHTLLEQSVGDPTMESLGIWFLDQDSRMSRVVVRRPTIGFAVEVCR